MNYAEQKEKHCETADFASSTELHFCLPFHAGSPLYYPAQTCAILRCAVLVASGAPDAK